MQRARRSLGPGPEPLAKRRSPRNPPSLSRRKNAATVRFTFVFGVYGAAFLRRTSWKNSKNDRKPPDKINHKSERGAEFEKTKTAGREPNSSRFNYDREERDETGPPGQKPGHEGQTAFISTY